MENGELRMTLLHGWIECHLNTQGTKDFTKGTKEELKYILLKIEIISNNLIKKFSAELNRKERKVMRKVSQRIKK